MQAATARHRPIVENLLIASSSFGLGLTEEFTARFAPG
jgi:hypothetical protein